MIPPASDAPPPATDPARFRAAVGALRHGGVILYPTETVYGLGGDARSGEAASRIRRLKGNPPDKPLLVLTDTWARVAPWLAPQNREEEILMAHEPPLPLTLLLRVRGGALPGARGAADRLGIRRTPDPVCRALIRALDAPLLSTSANPAGAPAPASFDDVAPEIRAGVDAAIEAVAPLGGVASTVCLVDAGELRVLRPGAVSADRLRSILDDPQAHS